jgi:hypothetical protein
VSRLVAFLVVASCAQAQQSILFPLAFGETCSSSVTLQNVSDEDSIVWLTAHKSSGALVPLTGAHTSRLAIPTGATVNLRLQVEGEEDHQAWVLMRERGPPSIALSGAVECLDGGELKTIAASVVFPAPDPWIRGDIADFHANEVWVLNASASPARAALCYSSGSYSQLPDGSKPADICSDEEDLYLPPFGMRTAPVIKSGNSRFSLRATGDAIALRLVVPTPERKKKFSVDSSIEFTEVPRTLKR